MTLHEGLPLDDLVSGPIVNDGVSSELLTAGRTLEVASRVVRRDHVGIALDERTRAFFFVAIEQGLALGAMYCDGERISSHMTP